MTPLDTSRACDAVWEALAATPARRALLGRRMADSIVQAALEEMPPVVAECGIEGVAGVMERRVRRRIEDRHGFAFTTILLSWAISAIVQALVAYWWRQQVEGRP